MIDQFGDIIVKGELRFLATVDILSIYRIMMGVLWRDCVPTHRPYN